MSRYATTFAALAEKGEGAFVPFLMLGDPTPEAALEIVRTVVEAGADALELGVSFSDPVADGPTIQKAHIRALRNGGGVNAALEQVRAIRAEFPDLPIGMLVYANVAFTRGLDNFYREFAEAGADSMLLPDVPVRESGPFSAAAAAHGIDPIYIAPAKASSATLEGVAAQSRGYIYAISRDGVTGTERASSVEGLAEVVDNVARYGGAPVLLGFGISRPEHVRAAIQAGAAGAITGSAIAALIEAHSDLGELKEALRTFVSEMKSATR
ncbi:tryptophan synthase subunit alpha [Corynebacterium timonense]|uniref:Tryptophan synthase alpha chain n=1 Tax=Corynebacterium timonense TaxID=441500 RepID=A0A1H1UH92_9CORY|nr:tryptophan synthase subunit alpha [Corynebacterium timonense]SDS71867.1 tryptophan synthase, alpha chain [Corynebacterium timonense]